MDQIWLASPSPALRLWPGINGATWRLNPAASAWARSRQLTEASWRRIAVALSELHARGTEREGRLAEPALRWRSLPMSTGWLVWLMPDDALPADPLLPTDAAELLAIARSFGTLGVFEWKPDKPGIRADADLRRLFGFDPNGSVPSMPHIVARLHPDDRERVESEHRRFAAMPGRHSIAYRLRLDDGSERSLQSWLDVRAAVEGEPARMLGIVVDHTATAERVGAGETPANDFERTRGDQRDGRAVIVGDALDATDRMERLVAAERMLPTKGAHEQTSPARSEFLAKMSHELRTPLNAVLGFAQLIEHDGESVPLSVQLDRVVHIRGAGEQLLRLVGDVLEHLKREAPGDIPETAPAALDSARASGPPDRALSVLYIEDNPVNVILVEELVAMRPNTSLRCAVTGLAGVALAAAGAPDVVLVDMQLPDIDGFEVLRRLRTHRSLDGSAVIALSANGMGDDIALALAAGFDDYWTKPIDFRHFLSGLDALAGSR